ncbi:DUF3052 domain-containing protein [Streptomyces sp. B-S-A8]|uniref:DUF3052 domain-containing protein n=1 Tax=Streptomyces solicavernae TaxID=3043614 RepID=A0ABT6RTC6_9ACTN|nr:DUF3052 domain-containing protein [Streptomyces sp. B-S-A8]MDI3387674.1 DUF3052 domain-containing protein [Streptomyces sp. B-S-A8]
MPSTADHAEQQDNPAMRLGFGPGQVVREVGHGDDVDQDLREGIEEVTGLELVDEDHDDVADFVLLWFRSGDGDLINALVDAIELIDGGGEIWLCTPKTGRDGYIEPNEINEAAQTTGLSQTRSMAVARDWSGARLTTPKSAKSGKR